MPAIGYALGMNFAEYIERFDHWIALILLGFIGLNMIYGSGVDEIQTGGRLTFGAVLVQGFASAFSPYSCNRNGLPKIWSRWRCVFNKCFTVRL